MSRLRKYRKSGETLVEVMVCAVLFLLMAAVMQGAVSFGTNALHKSARIRETNQEICRALRTAETAEVKTVGYTFRAVSQDGSTAGSEVFTIQVPLGSKTVSYEDEQGGSQTAVFYLYGPVKDLDGGTGGGDP